MPGIGEFIRRRRKQIEIDGKPMTQVDLAEALTKHGHAYASSTIGWWENGRATPPIHDTSFMNALADSLGVSLNALVEAIGIYDPTKQVRADDISPLEQELLTAYRNGQIEEAMRILLQNSGTHRQ